MGGGHTALVAFLLERGADVNAIETADHYNALTRAVHYGNVSTVRLLLAHGADVNVKTGFGYSALSLAKDRKSAELVERLRKAGAKE